MKRREPLCSFCERRRPLARIAPLASPRARRAARRGRAVSLKDHDLCARCWRTLLTRAAVFVIINPNPKGGRP